MIKFSIVVPVYNASDYVVDCLDSILNQFYDNFEVIIIDDGSTDGSQETCLSYIRASRDKRLSIHRISNSGVSVARNTGLSIATGDYVCFIDADDFIDRNYLSAFCDAIEKTSVDVIYAGFRFFPSRLEKKPYFNTNGKAFSGIELIEEFPQTSHTDAFSYAWRCCYRREFLLNNRLAFPRGVKFSEDVVFNLNVFAVAKSIVSASVITYNYRINNQESSARTNRYDRMIFDLESEYQARKRVLSLLSKSKYEFELDIVRRNYWVWLPRLLKYYKSENELKLKVVKTILSKDLFVDSARFLINYRLLDTKTQRIYYRLIAQRCSFLVYFIWKYCDLRRFL